MSIYATEYKEGVGFSIDTTTHYGKQILFLGVSLFVAFMILIIDSIFYSNFAWIFYIVILLSLVAVLLFGKTVHGGTSWFELGPIRIQPAEFGKFAASIALAKYLSIRNVKFENWRSFILAGVIILIPMILIFLQHDTGSMLVFCSFLFVFYREGLPAWIVWGLISMIVLGIFSLVFPKFVLIGILTVLAAIIIWMVRSHKVAIGIVVAILFVLSGYIFTVDFLVSKLEKHQRDRIRVIYSQDPISELEMKTIAYNLYQSKIAIGAGGIAGRGYLNGLQTKGNFVPEMNTDFIFSTFAEEWGFIGSTILILLYLFLMIRLILRAEQQRSSFSRIYGYGVVSIFFFHFMINIGMTIGLLPVIGIPLPYISYGGSSLLAFTILLFVFLKIDTDRQSILR